MKYNFLSSLLLGAVLVLAACGGGSEQGSAPAAASTEAIDVVMNDIYYGDSNDNATNPPTWNVTSGAKVTVSMDNKGVLEHNWAVVKLSEQLADVYDEATDQAKLLFNAGVLSGGQMQTVDFTAPLPGEYKVICTVPGPLQVMQGNMVVK